MSLQETIARVIKSARALRTIADKLGDVELKSQIVDEIDRLQELRDEIAPPPVPAAVVAAASDSVHDTALDEHDTVELTVHDSAMLVIKPSDEGDTYGLHLDESSIAPPAATGQPSPTDAHGSGSGKGTPVADLSEEQRLMRGEAVLRKLEPRHQAALKRMNDILTEEQKLLKRTVTRDGQAAGKSAAEIQQSVLVALDLTEKQQQLMSAARKELQEIRNKIAAGVDGLLSDDQRQRLQKAIARELSPGTH